MSNDINKVILICRVVGNPKLTYIPSGTAVAKFSIANNKTYTANGEKKEQVSFFNCVAWAKLAEIITEYCKKGHRIAIEGRLQQRSWEDQSGNKRSTVEIVVDTFQFLQPKADGQNNKESSTGTSEAPQATDNDKGVSEPFDEDLIPF